MSVRCISWKPGRALPPTLAALSALHCLAAFLRYGTRSDRWRPDCWREQTANRRLRREELREVAKQIAAQPRATPLLLGGDFNAPAGDAIFRLLQPRPRDTFREAGLSWGDTILNELPLQRIDQVWISDSFRPAAVVARKTQSSDHRLVVCDLFLSSRSAQ